MLNHLSSTILGRYPSWAAFGRAWPPACIGWCDPILVGLACRVVVGIEYKHLLVVDIIINYPWSAMICMRKIGVSGINLSTKVAMWLWYAAPFAQVFVSYHPTWHMNYHRACWSGCLAFSNLRISLCQWGSGVRNLCGHWFPCRPVMILIKDHGFDLCNTIMPLFHGIPTAVGYCELCFKWQLEPFTQSLHDWYWPCQFL